ncbi:MAG: signal peptidase II [Clostridia bacterium]|nr:signal peptidase II [Clostridia bacterium]
MKIKTWVKYTIFGFITAVLTLIDQLTKIWMVDIAQGIEGKGIVVIKNVLNFTYLKNDGASMGLFGGQRVPLIIMTLVIFAAGIYYFVKKRPDNWLLLSAVSLVASGAVGNLIDRITLGYVRDFIDLQFINFYIFNFADCAICVGAALLIIYAFLNVKD